MSIIKYLKQLFSKKKTVSKQIDVIDLQGWNYLCRIDDGYKRTLIKDIHLDSQKLSELCGALVYIDEKNRKRWVDSARDIGGNSFKQKFEMNINNKNISKLQSDRLKAHVANNYTKWDKWVPV